jgi:glycosyltransferase involved in cell wall biosynthesis
MTDLLRRALRVGKWMANKDVASGAAHSLFRKNWMAREGTKSGIIVASYNTATLISHLLFSIFRILDRKFVARIVVVDNGSTDGTLPLLRELKRAGLIDLIENRRQKYHGPALNQAVNYLKKITRRSQSPADAIRYILIVDSDTVVLRPDLLDKSIAAIEDSQAALAGQFQSLDYYDFSYAHISCILFKPHLVWRRRIAPFDDGGEPGLAMQISMEKAGLKRLDFPFRNHGFLVHLGRGTLRAIYENEEKDNKHYEWSRDHHEQLYHNEPFLKDSHEEFLQIFREVGNLTPESLLKACIKPDPIRLESPWKAASGNSY